MRILVTGGHGFVGRHVVAALDAAGADVTTTYHPDSSPVPGLPAESSPVDLEDAPAVAVAARGAGAVVHLAARAGGIHLQERADPDLFHVNRRITDNVLAACVAHRIPRLFLASSQVIYRPSASPLDEGDPQVGIADDPSPYAWSKVCDEVVARWVPEVEAVVGRLGNVYGPGAPFEVDRSTVIHALIGRAMDLEDGASLQVWGSGSTVRSFVFVEDVARAVALILRVGEAGAAYNVDTGRPVSIGDLAAAVVREVNPSVTIDFDPSKPAGLPFRVAAIDRLAALGFTPEVDLDEGLQRTVAWYRANR